MRTNRKYFTFNGESSADYGLFINGRGTYDSPRPDLDFVQIPGRSGDLIYDNKRFENIDVIYPACFTLDNFRRNFKAVQEWLLSSKGYQRLEDSYNPEYFRMATVAEAIELSEIEWSHDAGSFDLVFNCKPQRWLVSGEESIEIDLTGLATFLKNPTKFEAKPLIRVYGYGTIYLNEKPITVASQGVAPYIDIDSESMNCSHPSANMNAYVTTGDEYPVLTAGTNNIMISQSGMNFTKILITPRWWTI